MKDVKGSFQKSLHARGEESVEGSPSHPSQEGVWGSFFLEALARDHAQGNREKTKVLVL